MLGGIPTSIQHGHELQATNLTRLLINGEWYSDVLVYVDIEKKHQNTIIITSKRRPEVVST